MSESLNTEFLPTKDILDGIEFSWFKGKKRKKAVFAMAQNEPVFLPIWLKYYSQSFDAEDIFVLDHRTTDGSVEKCAEQYSFNNIKLDYPYSFDHVWFQFVAKTMQRKLLNYYEYVLFTDIDEIILPDLNKYSGLDEYINQLDEDHVRCTGFEITHMKDKEPTFDSTRTVLSQRNHWHYNRSFNKTALARVPLNWGIGFHKKTLVEQFNNKELYLIHLHKVDYEMCWTRTLERSKLRWKKEEVDKKRGWQNRITDSAKFDSFFYVSPRIFWILPRWLMIKEIPEELKTADIF
jgi:hypothetical protein